MGLPRVALAVPFLLAMEAAPVRQLGASRTLSRPAICGGCLFREDDSSQVSGQGGASHSQARPRLAGLLLCCHFCSGWFCTSPCVGSPGRGAGLRAGALQLSCVLKVREPDTENPGAAPARLVQAAGSPWLHSLLPSSQHSCEACPCVPTFREEAGAHGAASRAP